MNSQSSFESSLPFFDSSVKRVKLPQPICSPRLSHSLEQITPQRPYKARTARRTPSHSRTPSWDISPLPSSEAGSPRPTTTFSIRRDCFTPRTSRSPSPMERPPAQRTSTKSSNSSLHSPPLTPTSQSTLPCTASMSNYQVRLEPASPGEAPQAVVVFPNAATPTRGLLLVGPAIEKHAREHGNTARMHPYRVVLRPTP